MQPEATLKSNDIIEVKSGKNVIDDYFNDRKGKESQCKRQINLLSKLEPNGKKIILYVDKDMIVKVHAEIELRGYKNIVCEYEIPGSGG